MADYEDVKEEWNTGAGYYYRINQLLNMADEHQITGDKNKWYSVLLCLYKEIVPKLKGEQLNELKEELQKILQANNENRVGSSMLFLFEIKIREMLEHKGMLTPLGNDPSNAYLNG